MGPRPLVWFVTSHRLLGNEDGRRQPYTVVDESGSRTAHALGLQPVAFPQLPAESIADVLEGVDGVFLGGSATHVHPQHYGQAPLEPDMPYDSERDALSLPLARAAVAAGVPLMGVCRGSHELAVAFGSTLHQRVHAVPGLQDHRAHADEDLHTQYLDRHAVDCVPEGALAAMTGCDGFSASSLHEQGVATLGPALVAEAHAGDGLVEAFRHGAAPAFAWGFQFHPEVNWAWQPAYRAILEAFRSACHARHAERLQLGSV